MLIRKTEQAAHGFENMVAPSEQKSHFTYVFNRFPRNIENLRHVDSHGSDSKSAACPFWTSGGDGHRLRVVARISVKEPERDGTYD